jgi:hypothetical protein
MRWPYLPYVVLALSTSSLAATRCGDSPGDESAIAVARSAIEANCPCVSAPDAHRYRSCAKAVILTRVANDLLPVRCRNILRRCVVRSNCGRTDEAPCCRTPADGDVRCRIMEPDRCTASGGCVSPHASCCDACGPSGCTPTTSTTLGPRTCGNYIIDQGEVCDGEPFCENCFAYPRVCCQFSGPGETCSYDMDPPFVCDPGYPDQMPKYGVTATGTDICTAGFGTNGPCGTPQSFFPTPICCEPPGACTTTVVSDTAELTVRILSSDCLLFQNGQPVPVYVVGTCSSPTGRCLRGH